MFKSVEFSQFVTAAGLNTTPFLRANRGNPTPLLDIATRDIVSLSLNNTLSDAARIMVQRCVSCIVVEDGDGLPLGIITESNILQAMQSGGSPCSPLKEAMSSPVISVAQVLDCQAAYQLCLRENIRHLVLVDADGVVTGVVSETDFRLHMNLSTLAGRRLVASVMSSSVLSLPPDASLGDALNLMQARHDSCVVVTEAGKPVGIITERDVVRFFANAPQCTAAPLRKVMVMPAKTISSGATIHEAAERMLESKTRHLVVVGRKGQLLGLVREHDLIRSVTGDLMDTRLDAESTFLRTLVNTIPDLVWLQGHDGVFLACNAAFERLCSAKESDIIGKRELDFVAATQAGFFLENDQSAMVSGNSCRHEAWLNFADGYCGLFEAIKTPMRDSLGKLIGVLGVARDITANRRAQEVRERDFRTLAENLPDNVARWDVTGRYLYINPTHERTLGVSASAIIGTAIQGLGKTAIEKVIATGEAETFAYQTVLVDGVSQIHDVSMVPECDDEGRIVSVLGLGRNMTEVYRLQDELAAKECELRALAESSPGMMGAFYLRPDGSMCMPYVSHKIKELFGLQPQDVVNDASALLALTHPEDARRVADTIATSAQNMSMWHEEYRIIHPTCGERWMESNTNPQLHPQGGIVWYGYIHDITERKRMEEQLAQREQEFRSLAESSPDSIIRYDLNHHILYLNDLLVRDLELASDNEVIGKRPIEVWPDGRFAVIDEAAKRVIASGTAETVELVRTRDHAVPRVGQIVVVPERDATGRVIGTLAFGRDITAIREAERKLAHFIDNLPGLSYTYRLSPEGSGSFPYVSSAIEDIYGLKVEDVRNDSAALHALAHPDDQSRIEAALAESMQTMRPFQIESRVCRPGLPERWIDVRSVPEHQPDGSILWYGLMLDITERKQTQRRVEMLGRAIDLSSDSIFLVNEQYRFRYVNETACRSLGYTRQELLSMGPFDIDPALTPEAVNEKRNSTAADQAFTFETYHRRRDGRAHPVELSCTSFMEGPEKWSLVVARDITERKRAEVELQSREQKFRSLAESSPDCVLRYDLEQRMLYLNSVTVQALALASADAVVGQRPIEVWPDGRFAVIDAASKRVIESGNQEEIELIQKNSFGELQIAQILVVPERSVDGEVIGSISFGRDITAMREGERRLAHFLDNLPGLAFTFRVTPEGRGCFPFMSSAIKEFYGLEPADVMNDMAQLHALAHPDDQSRIEEAIARSVQTQTGMRVDFRVCRPGHPERWLNVISVPNRQPDGPSLWYGIMLDVTERKQAEHAVLKLNADLSATISAIPDLLFEVDREGHQLRVHTGNPDFAGRSVIELLTPDTVGIVIEALDQADEARHSYGKVIGVCLAGHACWFELSVAKKMSYPDADVTFIVLARNVTERIEAEQRIKEYVHFLEGMDLVNKAIQGADDIQTMMSHALDVVLSIFGCDRAFLLHPCDPDAARWTIPMERHRPKYPGALSMDIDLPHNQAIADKMRLLLSTDGPVKFGGDAEHATPPDLANQFQVQSLMSIAIYPQTGSPWEFGIHQCSGARNWKPWEEQLFQAVGRRLSDSLSALLAYQNLLGSEEKLRQSNKQLLELTMRREADREDERKRIAREIHDELGQNLTALRMGISQLRFQFGAANPELASHIEHMHKLATSTLQTVRDVTKSLRPPVLDAGIGAALMWLVNEFQQSAQVAFCLNLPSDSLVVDDEHALAIFRIVQESLTNVVRHASATRVDVTVQEEAGFLHIGIADNGHGFDADKIKMGGFGLIGMSERARMTGGSFEVQTQQGEGTRLTAIIPAQKLKESL